MRNQDLPALGKTYYDGNTDIIPSSYTNTVPREGSRKEFENITTIPTGWGARTLRHGGIITAILVRNVHTEALAVAKKPLVWSVRDKRIAAVSDTINEEIAGIGDPFLTGSVEKGDMFWLIVQGTVLAAKATGTAWSDGSILLADGNGVLTVDGTPADATAAADDAHNIAARANGSAASGDSEGLVDVAMLGK